MRQINVTFLFLCLTVRYCVVEACTKKFVRHQLSIRGKRHNFSRPVFLLTLISSCRGMVRVILIEKRVAGFLTLKKFLLEEKMSRSVASYCKHGLVMLFSVDSSSSVPQSVDTVFSNDIVRRSSWILLILSFEHDLPMRARFFYPLITLHKIKHTCIYEVKVMECSTLKSHHGVPRVKILSVVEGTNLIDWTNSNFWK